MNKAYNFKNLQDEEILKFIEEGNIEALEYLMKKYKNLIKIISKKYYLLGCDKEDIIQEGFIGLYKAVKGYNPLQKASFSTFANLCINRQMMTAIKTNNRKKHSSLNTSISLDDIEEAQLESYNLNKNLQPEQILIYEEDVNSIKDKIKDNLSKKEYKILCLILKGLKYTEISQILDINLKSIDNSLQRIKRKLSTYEK